jgi:hypothetical protein
MSEQNDGNGMENTFLLLQSFNIMVQSAEIAVHREIICLLTAKGLPTPQGAIDEAEIQRRVDARINTMLAEMADSYPTQASAFAKLLEARKNQRQS